jgi:hypothetical protein
MFLAGALLNTGVPAQQPEKDAKFPCPERLTYRIEWRLVTAGAATVETRGAGQGWDLSLTLQSAGLVSRLYKVFDKYKVVTGDRFCGSSAVLEAQEGKKHTLTRLTFDHSNKKVTYDERDLINGTSTQKELPVPSCTYEVIGALAALRLMPPEAGKSITVPITSGKKLASVRIAGEIKENVNIDGKNYSTVRYEAFLFDNVLYKRKGRLFIWMTDGPEHLPVQLQLHLGFPIGNITIQLDKEEKL